MRNFLLGLVVGYVLLAAVGFAAVENGWLPGAADQRPGWFETWVAHRAQRAAVRRESRGLRDPLPVSDQNLEAGANVYARHCADCHGSADGKPSAVARGMWVPAPQFPRDGVENDPEERTYATVAHGIRYTGMPAFGGALSETQVWQVSQFLSRLDRLPGAAQAVWKGIPSGGGDGPAAH